MAESGGVRYRAKVVEPCAKLRISDYAHSVRMDDQIVVADMRSGRYLDWTTSAPGYGT